MMNAGSRIRAMRIKKSETTESLPSYLQKTRICPIPLSLQVSTVELVHLPLPILLPLLPTLLPSLILTHLHFCPSCYESKEVWSFCDSLCGRTLRAVFPIWDKLYCSPFFPYPSAPCIISAEYSVARHFSWIRLGLLGFFTFLASFVFFYLLYFFGMTIPVDVSARVVMVILSLSLERTHNGIEFKR